MTSLFFPHLPQLLIVGNSDRESDLEVGRWWRTYLEGKIMAFLGGQGCVEVFANKLDSLCDMFSIV